MAKKSSKIKASVLKPFLGDLSDALEKSDLQEARDVMARYGIDYSTKYTQNRYVLEQIIMGASLPFARGKSKKLPRELTNRLALIQEFLENGVDATELDNYGGNMLGAADYAESPQCYKLLLDHGADPNVVNKYDQSPLSMNWRRLFESTCAYHFSSVQPRIEILELLLRAGANPWCEMLEWHCKNKSQAYLIMTLTNQGCVLVRQRINPILYDLFLNDPELSQTADSSSSKTPEYKREISQLETVRAVYSIRPLVREGNLDGAVDMLRQQFGIDYTTTIINNGQYFMTALIGEMNELLTPDKKEQHDHYMALITRFLDNGVDVNHLDNRGVFPLLSIAAFNREPELCKLLIKHGADKNYRNQFGVTAIRAAINSYHFDNELKIKTKECVSLLLKEKVVINEPIKLVTHTTDGVNRIYDTDSTSQGLLKMFRKYGYLPKEEDEKAGK